MPLGRISLPETVDDPNASDDNSISASESRVGKETAKIRVRERIGAPLVCGIAGAQGAPDLCSRVYF